MHSKLAERYNTTRARAAQERRSMRTYLRGMWRAVNGSRRKTYPTSYPTRQTSHVDSAA